MLYRPSDDVTINAFRAYFHVDLDAGEAGGGEVRAFVLNFGDDSEETGISDTPRLNDKGQMINDAWYDLSGRKLSGKPTVKGLYIYKGKKVAVQ